MEEVFIIDGRRTPQVKAGGEIKDILVPYLGVSLVQRMMDTHQIPYDKIDEVIMGNTGAPAKYPNISRVIALEAGLHKKTSAYTVHRNCASGMEAIDQGYLKIKAGESDLVLVGGVESMSQMPLVFSKELTEIFLKVMRAKSAAEKIKLLGEFRLPFLSPVVAIEQGLTDPVCGLNMGETAELLAREMKITREEQDAFALKSHQKTLAAAEEGKFAAEIVPLLYGSKLEKILLEDIGPRKESSMEKLAKLRPYFEPKSGTVTVGNSCPITDGGAALLLASAKAVETYQLTPVARIKSSHFAGLEPQRMGMGPLVASAGALKKSGDSLVDMDLIEINEAFAAQVLAVKKAAKEKEWAQKFGLESSLGEIADEKLNVNGGAIALGHPVGASGCRIVVTLIHEMQKRKSKTGLASLCIGGGQGGALVVERT